MGEGTSYARKPSTNRVVPYPDALGRVEGTKGLDRATPVSQCTGMRWRARREDEWERPPARLAQGRETHQAREARATLTSKVLAGVTAPAGRRVRLATAAQGRVASSSRGETSGSRKRGEKETRRTRCHEYPRESTLKYWVGCIRSLASSHMSCARG